MSQRFCRRAFVCRDFVGAHLSIAHMSVNLHHLLNKKNSVESWLKAGMGQTAEMSDTEPEVETGSGNIS